MPWNDTFECMPVVDLQKFQLEKLKETVAYAYERVPFYRRKLDELKVKPGDIQCLEDVAKLPFTVKNDLRDNYGPADSSGAINKKNIWTGSPSRESKFTPSLESPNAATSSLTTWLLA